MPNDDPKPVRRHGEHIWRASGGLQIAWLVVCLAFLAGTTSLHAHGGLSTKQTVLYAVSDVCIVIFLPVMRFRWRMVLDPDELVFVFLRVRRLPLAEIVEAKSVVRQGLVFVCKDGTEESFGALANSARAHRRDTPTKADLAARTVLCAAARVRGEPAPVDYRLPPLSGVRRAALEGGVVAFILGLFLSD